MARIADSRDRGCTPRSNRELNPTFNIDRRSIDACAVVGLTERDVPTASRQFAGSGQVAPDLLPQSEQPDGPYGREAQTPQYQIDSLERAGDMPYYFGRSKRPI